MLSQSIIKYEHILNHVAPKPSIKTNLKFLIVTSFHRIYTLETEKFPICYILAEDINSPFPPWIFSQGETQTNNRNNSVTLGNLHQGCHYRLSHYVWGLYKEQIMWEYKPDIFINYYFVRKVKAHLNKSWLKCNNWELYLQ